MSKTYTSKQVLLEVECVVCVLLDNLEDLERLCDDLCSHVSLLHASRAQLLYLRADTVT
jgi:hypothetical protein